MALPFLMVFLGLILLVWNADIFAEGTAAFARYIGISSLLIGMIVIGFGTSLSEICVSVLSAPQGNSGLALGYAYGPNTTNVALILGLFSIISPINPHSQIARKDLPILFASTLFVFFLLYDGLLSRMDGAAHLLFFAGAIGWMHEVGIKSTSDSFTTEIDTELKEHAMTFSQAMIWLLAGLIILVISFRLLAWGGITITHQPGISDLIIGLTIVAIGTSLPKLASSVMATRKREDDLAFGNVIGSNLFNTLAVANLAGTIQPITILLEIIHRDWIIMTMLNFGILRIKLRPNWQRQNYSR